MISSFKRTLGGTLPHGVDLLSDVSSDADRSAVLSDWLQHYQPCLFGRIAAQRGLMSYCILTTADIEKGDAFVRDKIQASRTVGRSEAE